MKSSTKKILLAISEGTDAIIKAAIPLSVAHLADDYVIESARKCPDPQRNLIKDDVSLAASVADVFITLLLVKELIETFIVKRAWQYLKCGDVIAISILLLSGMVGFAYAFSRIGSEKNTFAAGASTAASVLLFSAAKIVLLAAEPSNRSELHEETHKII